VPVIELQLLILMNTLMTIWYFLYNPHLPKRRWKLQMFHECVNMVSTYHLFIYTEAYSPHIQLDAGFSFYINVLILIGGNLAIIFYDTVIVFFIR
jgi:hypothetical protein